MIYCKKCVMPSTRPNTIFKDGICQACTNYENRKNIDWNSRWAELEQLCSQYRSSAYYDCVIAVSGGKDSHYLTYIMKEKLGMNPLLVRVKDAFSNTIAGTANITNIAKAFNCDMVEFSISPDLYKRLTRYCFEEYANFPFIDGEVYTVPAVIANLYGIKLIVYGENPAYEFGTSETQGYSALWHTMSQSETMKKLMIECTINPKEYSWLGVNENDYTRTSTGLLVSISNTLISPKITPIFMSYFVPWSGYNNYQIAKQFGFRDLHNEWQRAGCLPQDTYEQIDIVGWQVSSFLKYIKFGFGRATDIACRLIRENRMTREEAVKLVNEYDGKLDQKELDDFLSLTGYSVRGFYETANEWYNRDIFENINGVWRKREECLLK